MLKRLKRLFGEHAPATPQEPESNRNGPEEWKNRGNTHFNRGEVDAALRCYEESIRLDPDYGEAHNNLGLIYLGLQRWVEAERHLKLAVAAAPNLVNAHYNFGIMLQQTGRAEEALESFRAALSLDPGLADAHFRSGMILQQMGRPGEAAVCLARALEFAPDVADAPYELGNLYFGQNQLDAAALYYERAIAVDPEHSAAQNNLAVVFIKQGRLDEALACAGEAIRIAPGLANAHHNRADILQKQGRLDEALTSANTAISLDPHFAAPYITKGLVLKGQGRFDEALECLRQAHELDPELRNTLFIMSAVLLSRGDLGEGWKLYRHRYLQAGERPFRQPQWTGQDLADKSILVWGDQGIGDEILFASMLPDIIARSRRCIVECAPKLVPLFARSFPGAVVIPCSDPPNAATTSGIDFQIAAPDAAQWLRPRVDSFPQHQGYLAADPARVAYWRARLAEELGPGMKVGFCWRSSARSDYRNLHYTRLDQWGPIFAVPGVRFVSLQYDECAAELTDARERFGVSLHAYPEVDLYDDLLEAAALTKAMDVVITVATSAGRLAAAQGVPTWEMNYGVTWVSLGTDGIPWLPSQRLFTRRWDQPWEEIIAAVAEELARNASGEKR